MIAQIKGHKIVPEHLVADGTVPAGNDYADSACDLLKPSVETVVFLLHSTLRSDVRLTTAKATLPPALRDLIRLKCHENPLPVPFQF